MSNNIRCLTKHLTYQALLKSSVKLNWSGWWTKSSKPEGPVTWKWHWLGGCTQVKAMTHVTLWITDQPLWVFSSKNTATAMRKRTQTQQPQQNGSCPQTWLPNTREQEPEPIYLMSLQKKVSLQLVSFFPLLRDVRALYSEAMWLTPRPPAPGTSHFAQMWLWISLKYQWEPFHHVLYHDNLGEWQK